MLSHAPEEPSLATLLRRTVTRLREHTPHADAENDTAETGEAADGGQSAGVPLVLPFDRERRLMPRLLRRLRRGRFLRYRPDSLNEYAPLTPFAADYYLNQLRAAKPNTWRECIVSIWALGRLSEGDPKRVEAEQLLCRMFWTKGAMSAFHAGLGDDRDRSTPVYERWHTVVRAQFLIWTLWQSAMMLYRHSLEDYGLFLGGLIAILFFSFPTAILTFVISAPRDRQHSNRMRATAILTLGRWRDPRHLDLLVREYVGSRGRIRDAAAIALREVLPLLHAGEATARPADFVPNLCRALQRKERQVLDYTFRDEAFELLLLEALGKVGDGRALPVVERIARRGRTLPLQELARNILPVLHARSRQANDPNQLLRSANQPQVASDTLLRPAHNSFTPPDQLLRPHPTAPDQDSAPVQRNSVQQHKKTYIR